MCSISFHHTHLLILSIDLSACFTIVLDIFSLLNDLKLVRTVDNYETNKFAHSLRYSLINAIRIKIILLLWHFNVYICSINILIHFYISLHVFGLLDFESHVAFFLLLSYTSSCCSPSSFIHFWSNNLFPFPCTLVFDIRWNHRYGVQSKPLEIVEKPTTAIIYIHCKTLAYFSTQYQMLLIIIIIISAFTITFYVAFNDFSLL